MVIAVDGCRKSSRSGEGGRSKSHGREQLTQALKAAVLSGAAEAFRARKEPGGWGGDKGKRVLTAAFAAVSLAVCGRRSFAEPPNLAPNEPPTNCDRLWMDPRFRRISLAAVSSVGCGVTDAARSASMISRREPLSWIVLIIVDLLLTRDGTSTDRRIS